MNTKKDRLSAFRKKLAEKNIDAALILKRENYLYLSGFTGTSAYLVITSGKAYLLTDFRYAEQAGMQAPEFEIVQYKTDVVEEIKDILLKCEVKELGFEEGYITFDKYRVYEGRLKNIALRPLEGIIEDLRTVKDAYELDVIKKAVEIADGAFTHVLDYIKPGVRETEIAAELEYHMKKLGASGASFETIVASGYRASMPHGIASEKQIEPGDAVTMDFGAVYQNYCSDMTRTVFVGSPADELKKIYGIVLEAHNKSMEGAIAGICGREVDDIARKIISAAGYGDCFGHGLGHGVGIEIHEAPTFSPRGGMAALNRMVVTIEPGIYITGLGGVRIEDMIVINENNPVDLTKSVKDMIIL